PIVRLKYERIAYPFTDLSLQLVRSTIFRYTFRPLSPFPYPRSAHSARLLYHIITDFITHNTRGNLVTRKVPIIISDPGETFVLIETNELSPPLYPKPNSSLDRVKYKPYNFVHRWKDAPSTIFTENVNATRRNLAGVLDQLKDM
ncbi:hypothetical protein N7534_004763, partial [Penicillium rubens]